MILRESDMSVVPLIGADGWQCAVHQLGGEGPPLLMTHGNGLNAGMWSEVVPLLRDRFECFALDFRGHGRAPSDDPFMPVDRALLFNDLKVAIDHIGVSPILTAGHSLGGVATVTGELLEPGTFAAAWLFEPVLIPEGFGVNRTGVTLTEISRKRRNVFDSVEDAYERFVSKPPYDGCVPAAVRAYVETGTYPLGDGRVQLSCIGENEARIYESGVPQDLSTYAAIECPMRIVRGGTADQGDVPAQVAEPVAGAIPTADLETHDHLTHFGPMEDPETIADSIVRFFAEVGAISR